MPCLLELEEEVFRRRDDGHQDDPPGGKEEMSRRFLASYIGCCDLQSGYTPTHLNYAIGQLADVSLMIRKLIISCLLRCPFVTLWP